MDWRGRKVLVTGGASFIGSHLVDALLERGAAIRVADDLSSGLLGHIKQHVDDGNVEFLAGDLREPELCRSATKDMSAIFHLAADHGGRGYVDTYQAGPATNLALDGQLFSEAVRPVWKRWCSPHRDACTPTICRQIPTKSCT